MYGIPDNTILYTRSILHVQSLDTLFQFSNSNRPLCMGQLIFYDALFIYDTSLSAWSSDSRNYRGGVPMQDA